MKSSTLPCGETTDGGYPLYSANVSPGQILTVHKQTRRGSLVGRLLRLTEPLKNIDLSLEVEGPFHLFLANPGAWTCPK